MTRPRKAEALVALGAGRTLAREDSVAEELGRDSIDVVVDLVGGPTWPELLEALRPGGSYAVAGALGGPVVELDLRTLYLKDLSLFGCTVLEPNVSPNLVEHIERGRLSPLVAQTFPLEHIAEAQATFLAKSHIGKIVLTVE